MDGWGDCFRLARGTGYLCVGRDGFWWKESESGVRVFVCVCVKRVYEILLNEKINSEALQKRQNSTQIKVGRRNNCKTKKRDPREERAKRM